MGHRTGQDGLQFGLFVTLQDEMIAPDNMVWVTDAYVDAVDLGKLGFTHVKAGKRGTPPFARRRQDYKTEEDCFRKEGFEYDTERVVYSCSAGEELISDGTIFDKHGKNGKWTVWPADNLGHSPTKPSFGSGK